MSGSSLHSPRIAPTSGHMSHVTRRKKAIQRPVTPPSPSHSSSSDVPDQQSEAQSDSDEAVDASAVASSSTSRNKLKKAPSSSDSSSPSTPPTPLSPVSLFRPIDRSRNRRTDPNRSPSKKQKQLPPKSVPSDRRAKGEDESSDMEQDEEFVPASADEDESSSSESEDDASVDNTTNAKKATLSKEDLIRQLLQPKTSQINDADADEDLHESDSSSSDGEVSIAQLRSIRTPAALDLDAQYAARELDAHRKERSASITGMQTGSLSNLGPQLDIQALVDHCIRGGLSGDMQATSTEMEIENQQLDVEHGIRVTSMPPTPRPTNEFHAVDPSSLQMPPAAAAAAAASIDDADDLLCRRSLSIQESRNERDKSRRIFHTKQLLRYTRRFKYAVHIHRIQQEYERQEKEEDGNDDSEAEERAAEAEEEETEHKNSSPNHQNASQSSSEPPIDLPTLVDPTQLSREFVLPATVDPDALFMPIRSNVALPVANDEDAEADPALMQNPECQTMLYRALRQFLQPIIQLLTVVKMQRQFILQNQRKKLVHLHASLRMTSYNRNAPVVGPKGASSSNTQAAQVSGERISQASPEMSDIEPASSSDSDDDAPPPRPISAPAAAALPPMSSTAEFKRQLAETGCITKKDVRDILAILGMQAKLPSFAELTENAAVPKSPAVTAASAQIPPSPLSGPIPSSSAVGANPHVQQPSSDSSIDESDDPEMSDAENILRLHRPRRQHEDDASSQSSRKGKPTGVSTFNAMQKVELIRLFEAGAISHKKEHENAREACLAFVSSLGTPSPTGERAPITASQVRTFLINYAARLKKKNPQAGRQFLRDMKERGNNRPDSGRKAPEDRIRTPKVKTARRIKRELDAEADSEGVDPEQRRDSPEMEDNAEVAGEQKVQGMRGFIRWDDLTKEQQEDVLRNQSASIRMSSGGPSSSSKSRKRKRRMEEDEEEPEDEGDADDGENDRREKKRLKKEQKRTLKKEKKKEKKRQKRADKQRKLADQSELEEQESDAEVSMQDEEIDDNE